MSKTNCVNCGAAKDTSELKCPFCGTTYLDFTSIDFSSDDPVVCQFVLPYTQDRVIMSMLAIPRLTEMAMTYDTASVTDHLGRPLHTVQTAAQLTCNVEFHPVCKPGDDTLFTVRKE